MFFLIRVGSFIFHFSTIKRQKKKCSAGKIYNFCCAEMIRYWALPFFYIFVLFLPFSHYKYMYIPPSENNKIVDRYAL